MAINGNDKENVLRKNDFWATKRKRSDEQCVSSSDVKN